MCRPHSQTPPPNPLPEAGRGSKAATGLFLPSPLRGGVLLRLGLVGLLVFVSPALAKQPVATADLTGTVVKVVDGQTVQLQLKDQHKPIIIRLIGLESPAKASRDKDGQEPWGTRAQQSLSLLLTRNMVRVEFDVQVPLSGDNTQRWGYVWLDKQLANEEMLRTGNAILATQTPNVRYVERLQAAQKQAPDQGARRLGSEGAAAGTPEPFSRPPEGQDHAGEGPGGRPDPGRLGEELYHRQQIDEEVSPAHGPLLRADEDLAARRVFPDRGGSEKGGVRGREQVTFLARWHLCAWPYCRQATAGTSATCCGRRASRVTRPRRSISAG